MSAVQLLTVEDDWLTYTYNGALYMIKRVGDRRWKLMRYDRRLNGFIADQLASTAGLALVDHCVDHGIEL